jgi:hypothetical protein
LALQQGAFGSARDVTKPFMENWVAMAEPATLQVNLIKFDVVCSPGFLEEALTELHRMSVNRATLFPGLDGFAMDLRNRFAMQHFFEGVKAECPSIWQQQAP